MQQKNDIAHVLAIGLVIASVSVPGGCWLHSMADAQPGHIAALFAPLVLI